MVLMLHGTLPFPGLAADMVSDLMILSRRPDLGGAASRQALPTHRVRPACHIKREICGMASHAGGAVALPPRPQKPQRRPVSAASECDQTSSSEVAIAAMPMSPSPHAMVPSGLPASLARASCSASLQSTPYLGPATVASLVFGRHTTQLSDSAKRPTPAINHAYP